MQPQNRTEFQSSRQHLASLGPSLPELPQDLTLPSSGGWSFTLLWPLCLLQRTHPPLSGRYPLEQLDGRGRALMASRRLQGFCSSCVGTRSSDGGKEGIRAHSCLLFTLHACMTGQCGRCQPAGGIYGRHWDDKTQSSFVSFLIPLYLLCPAPPSMAAGVQWSGDLNWG